MEFVLWASEGFNRSATTANGGMLSPYEIFYGSRPPMSTLPFCKPAYHRIPRQGKLDRQARLCFFLNFGDNHGSDCVKIMDAETGRIVHSRDVTWHQPREPLISSVPTVESEVPQSPSGAATSEYIYIQPAPAATNAPAAAPVPASDNAAPAPPRNLTEPIRDRVVRKLGHEGDVRMPGRTYGETRAFPRRLCDDHARTDATFIYGTIFRSPCRAVRYRSTFRAVQHRSSCRAARAPENGAVYKYGVGVGMIITLFFFFVFFSYTQHIELY